MPRKLRVEFPGANYHVMSRGDRREVILQDDVDRQDFLKTLAEACQRAGFELHAYCLLGNHFHLVVETPEPNLVAGWMAQWVGMRTGKSAASKLHQWVRQEGSKGEDQALADGHIRPRCTPSLPRSAGL